MNTNPPCPSCGTSLRASIYCQGWLVWCGNGRCTSVAANEGADAENVEKAVRKLKAAVKQEELE